MRKLLSIVALAGIVACGGSGNNPVNPAYQPQIVNVTDSFAFQLTGVQNGAGNLSYTWQNTGTSASINMSSSISSGTVTLILKDATGAQVYSGSLSQNGTFSAGTGVAGAWTVMVDFTNATGTINFRAQKL